MYPPYSDEERLRWSQLQKPEVDDPLPQVQLNHIHDLKQTIAALLEKKYISGAREHGGFIWDQTALQLLDNSIQEMVDLVVYLLTLREKLVLQSTQVIDR